MDKATHHTGSVLAERPVVSYRDGEVIENLDIEARSGNGITVQHQDVTIRNCSIRHARGHGVQAQSARRLNLQNLEIINVGAAPTGPGLGQPVNNVDLEEKRQLDRLVRRRARGQNACRIFAIDLNQNLRLSMRVAKNVVC